MKLKRNIAVVLACVLLASLGAAMIFGGCGKEEVPQWEGLTTAPHTTANVEASADVVDRGDETFAPATDSPTTAPTTAPATEPTEPSYDENGYLTWESYMALTGAEQWEYFQSFKTPDGKQDAVAFNNWYNAAKKAYDEAHPKETITDGNITLD